MSAEEDEEELYERLKQFEGRPAVEAGAGRSPVNEPMIRHWCEAMGHPVPADGSAPEPMLQVWTMGGLAGPAGRSTAFGELFALLDGAGCTSVVATDCEQEYARPLRPGAHITFDAVIESVSPRKTTRLGAGHFVTTLMRIRADGELAGTHRFRILKYAPADRKPEPKAEPEAEPKPESEPPAPAESRPRPVVGRDNAGFWAGVAERRLLIQRCTGCGTLRFPWLPGCHACGAPEWEAVEASGRGTVYSYVVMHHPRFPAFEPPYAVGLVELAEGVRIISNVTGVPPDEVRIGMPVRLEFMDAYADGDVRELPVFRAQEG